MATSSYGLTNVFRSFLWARSQLGGPLEDAARAGHRRNGDGAAAAQVLLLGRQRGLARPRPAEPALRPGPRLDPQRHPPRHAGPGLRLRRHAVPGPVRGLRRDQAQARLLGVGPFSFFFFRFLTLSSQ